MVRSRTTSTRKIEVSAEHLQVVSNREFEFERILLRHDAEATADLGSVGPRVESEDRDLPAVGWDTAEIIRMVLVLPAPFGPRKPKLSPRSMVTSIPFTASKSPKRFTS